MILKECSACGAIKPEADFQMRSDTGYRRKQCRSCQQAKQDSWRKANPDLMAQYGKTYRDANRELMLERTREWRRNNKAYDAFRAQLYRTRKIQRTPSWSNMEAIEAFYLACPPGYHVDHIVPLKGRKVSGLHVIENLQYLPAVENLRKRNIYHVG